MAKLALNWMPTIHDMIASVVTAQAREYMVIGTRGDGKTHGAFGAMIGHAVEHERKGFPLPTRWLGVTDKFTNHENKTHWSLQDPLWMGAWKLEKSGHAAGLYSSGKKYVHLDLVGVPDLSEVDKVRTECHGIWFEEPAPTAVMGDSAGIDARTWMNAMTSQRLPSYHHPAIMTLNYPEEDHWCWQRFLPNGDPFPAFPAFSDDPGQQAARTAWYAQYKHLTQGTHPKYTSRRWFRVPPGERASASQRKEWADAMSEYPDLLRRLIEGRPGSIIIGNRVADGFTESLHVSRAPLELVPNEPLAVGVDFGLTPTVVVGQVVRGEKRVLAAFPCERGGIKQHLLNEVLPWFAQKAHWALRNPGMIYGIYDPAGETPEQTDSDKNPVMILEELLPGFWSPGPIDWTSRHHTLLMALQAHVGPGQVALQIDPIECQDLIKALSNRWYYATDRTGQVRRDLPKKPNHPWEDLGDAFIYFLWALQSPAQKSTPVRVETAFAL